MFLLYQSRFVGRLSWTICQSIMRILSEAFSFQTRGQIELTSSVFDLFSSKRNDDLEVQTHVSFIPQITMSVGRGIEGIMTAIIRCFTKSGSTVTKLLKFQVLASHKSLILKFESLLCTISIFPSIGPLSSHLSNQKESSLYQSYMRTRHVIE